LYTLGEAAAAAAVVAAGGWCVGGRNARVAKAAFTSFKLPENVRVGLDITTIPPPPLTALLEMTVGEVKVQAALAFTVKSPALTARVTVHTPPGYSTLSSSQIWGGLGGGTAMALAVVGWAGRESHWGLVKGGKESQMGASFTLLMSTGKEAEAVLESEVVVVVPKLGSMATTVMVMASLPQ